MKLSKLDYDSLTEEERFNLVMSNIEDLSKVTPNDDTKADLIVVLGCSPAPLRARVLKMMELVRQGYGNNVLLSGGHGWEKLYKKVDPTTGQTIINEEKRATLLKAIEDTISPDLLGDNPTEKELRLHQRFIEGIRELGDLSHDKSYEEEQEDKKLKLSEAEFMKLIMLTNGGLKDAKFFHEPFSFSTKQNMEYTYALLNRVVKRDEMHKINRMIIVSSSFHCKRAYLTFKKFFPDVDILVCPATVDLESRGVSLGSLLEHPYYRQQIHNESNAIINYAKNGSIADLDVEEVVSHDALKSFVHMGEEIKD